MNEWIVLGGAILFRLLECIVKSWKALGKFDAMAVLKEFFSLS
jgi:hypothetical protein